MKRAAGLTRALMLVWISAPGLTAWGWQNPPDPVVRVRPQEERRQAIEISPARPIDRTPVLPTAAFPPEPGLAAIERIHVRRIVVEGLTLLTEEEVAAIAAPYQGRTISIEELYALRRDLSEACIRRGFINSGVEIPDQEIADGVVVLREVRGNLTKIDLTGNGRLRPGYITGRIRSAVRVPLRVQDLQQALEALQQDPLVQRINARLTPGFRPGEAELSVALKRTRSLQIAIGANNQGSASTGGEQGTLAVAHGNLLGHGDALSADTGVSGGRTIGSFAYSFPLTIRGARIQAAFALDNARIVEEPFKSIDIKSKTMRGSLFLSQPWLRGGNQSLVSSVGIERRHSESTLLGFPFSFSPGDQAGRSDTTVVSTVLEYSTRNRNQALAVRGNLRQGIHALHATENQDSPDGRFTAFLGQLHYARRLGSFGGELLFRWTGQFAADPLLALEKMPLGGLYTVRGYRENLFVRDDGLAGSLECRIPVRPGHASDKRFDLLNLRLAAFVDYGRSWDKDDALLTTAARDIYSAGFGLLWNPVAGLRLDAYWGHPFKTTGKLGDSIQDKGIHFALHYLIQR